MPQGETRSSVTQPAAAANPYWFALLLAAIVRLGTIEALLARQKYEAHVSAANSPSTLLQRPFIPSTLHSKQYLKRPNHASVPRSIATWRFHLFFTCEPRFWRTFLDDKNIFTTELWIVNGRHLLVSYKDIDIRLKLFWWSGVITAVTERSIMAFLDKQNQKPSVSFILNYYAAYADNLYRNCPLCTGDPRLRVCPSLLPNRPLHHSKLNRQVNVCSWVEGSDAICNRTQHTEWRKVEKVTFDGSKCRKTLTNNVSARPI